MFTQIVPGAISLLGRSSATVDDMAAEDASVGRAGRGRAVLPQLERGGESEVTQAGFATIRRYAVRILLGAMLVLVGSSASAQTPAVTVYFGDSAYSADEGGSVAVQVQLSANPERTVTIPLEATPGTGAGTGDFTVEPDQVIFNSGETSKSVTFTPTDDTEDDDDETVELSFGGLPSDVSEGSPNTTVVTIADNDDPAVTVSFESAAYTVTEGWTVDVMVDAGRRPRAQRDDSSRSVL